MTGFTPAQSAGILMREGHTCALADVNPRCTRRATVANHRLNRGAGGSKERNSTDNGCALCDQCNGDIESDAALAEIARHRGVKLRQGDDPRTVALWSIFYGQWVQLVGDALFLTGETDVTTRPDLVDPEALIGVPL